MSLLSDLQAHLIANCLGFSGRVSVARSVNNPEPTNLTDLPEAWVQKWESQSTGENQTQKTRQRRVRQFFVMYAATLEGDDGVDHDEAAMAEIVAAMKNYTVSTDGVPASYWKDEVITIEPGYIMRRIYYTYTDYIWG